MAARFALIEYTTKESSSVATYDLSQVYFRFLFTAGIEPTAIATMPLDLSVRDENRAGKLGTRKTLGEDYTCFQVFPLAFHREAGETGIFVFSACRSP